MVLRIYRINKHLCLVVLHNDFFLEKLVRVIKYLSAVQSKNAVSAKYRFQEKREKLFDF